MSLGPPQERATSNCTRPWPRSSHQDPRENLTRSSEKGTEELSYKLYFMASARSSCKDLLERISASPQDLLQRTCIGSRKDLVETRASSRSAHKDLCKINARHSWSTLTVPPILMQEFLMKMPQTKTGITVEPAQSKCTWTCRTGNFAGEFAGKKPENRWSTLIKRRP